MRLLFVILLVFIAAGAFALEATGNHGHILFRPWMIEDWLLWSAIVVQLMLAIQLFRSYRDQRGMH